MRTSRRGTSRGFTLAELLVAGSVTAMIGLAVSMLAVAVNTAQDYSSGRSRCAQHARVTLARIQRSVEKSYGNEVFPACVVFAANVGSNYFPDALVIWRPTGTPSAPTGKPLLNELVVYVPDPSSPNRLLECTRIGDTTQAPDLSNTSAWFTLIQTFATNSASTRTEMTNLLRTALPSNSTTTKRGAVRFLITVTPSESAWASYKAGTTTWTSLAWPLNFRSIDTGMRRVVCATELQLTVEADIAQDSVLPFFGSATKSYLLNR